MPFERNSNFTGRESELSRLEELLHPKVHTSTSKVAIYGLGGMGKTQLAIEQVYRTIEKFNCPVFWIPATDSESLYQGYLTVAHKLDIPGCDENDADVKGLVQNHLSHDIIGQWLLVFDNADDIEMWTSSSISTQESDGLYQRSKRLIDYLPKSKQGSILFTTRDRSIAVKLAQQ